MVSCALQLHMYNTMGWIEMRLGCGKFALRALSQCLAREFQPQGVHVAHVIIDGVIGPPRFVSFRLFLGLLDRSFPFFTLIPLGGRAGGIS